MISSRYASLLFGATTYKEIGPFRFPVYGELAPGEAKEIADIKRIQSSSSFKSLKLARKIATDRGITSKEAVDLLGNLDKDENEDLIYEYADDLAGAQDTQLTDEDVAIRYATIALRYRGELQIDGQWTQLKDWTEADTTGAIRSMPLVTEIHKFMLTEAGEGNAPGKTPTKERSTSTPSTSS
jgi:hypothetical protein